MSDSWVFMYGRIRIAAGHLVRLLPKPKWLALNPEQGGLTRMRDRRRHHRGSSRRIGDLTIFLRRVTAGTADRADPS